MQNDAFKDVINSIQFLNMSKNGEEQLNIIDSGFNSGTELGTDNIFFYEDHRNNSINEIKGSQDCIEKINVNDAQILNATDNHQVISERHQRRRHNNDQQLTQIKVNVGIDEDLKMILEMDPSLMDGNLEQALQLSSSHVVDCPKVVGLPPKM